MQTAIQLLTSCIVATTMMTLFSYLVSTIFKRLYKEPVLLALVLQNFNLSSTSIQVVAWVLHYLIGLSFVIIYHLIWKADLLSVSIENGILLGFISGIVGIIGWQIMFKAAKYTHKNSDIGYFLQLLIAHIIFGFFGELTYMYFL